MNQITIHGDGLCEPNPAGVACYGWTAEDESGAEIASAHGHLLSGDGTTTTWLNFAA